MKRFGLVGKRLDYSFSKAYFEQEYHNIYVRPARYDNYELPSAEMILPLAKEQHLDGLNVTIPFKEAVIPFLDSLSDEAKAIGVVNTLKFRYLDSGVFAEGHNTDAIGFEESVKPYLSKHSNALVLGTGGAAKAVAYVLLKHGLSVTYVSRSKRGDDIIGYEQLTERIVARNTLIVNATPLGTLGSSGEVEIPYSGVTPDHFCMDLVYNPLETHFSKECAERGATVKNGIEMLHRQAEDAWKIWNM
ncbi:MAG: shikimate dehydrogenase [Bacteroidales bacterium]|nr:shikimate dehydrogenase [Bacteroidales bacterium]